MTGRLHPYPAYRDSELPWLGKIPERWSLKRAKYLYREVDDRSTTGDEELLSVSHLTGVTPRREKNVTMFLAESNVGHKICHPGDLVINTMWAWMAALGVSAHKGLVSPSYGVYRPTSDGLASGYAGRLLRTAIYAAEYTRRSTGVNSSRLRLYPDEFLRIPILIPPMPDQLAIERFLKCLERCFSRYFKAKQRMLRLLLEKKQATVHQAITRGLSGSVQLKSSAIDWLGSVPAHWEVGRFKEWIAFQEGPGIMAEDFRDEGIPLLRISCLAGDVATLNGCNYLDPAMVAKKWDHFAIQPGDYLLSASGSLGSVCLATEIVAGAIPYTGILRIWPKARSKVTMDYVRYFMSSSLFGDQVRFMKAGVGIEHFGPTHLKRMLILLPPLSEQLDIAAVLDRQTSALDAAIEAVRRDVGLMRAYRTRLISDVVTGQLDVREAAASLPDEPDEPDELSLADEILKEAGEADLEVDELAEEVAE